jgi:hypothetical protein
MKRKALKWFLRPILTFNELPSPLEGRECALPPFQRGWKFSKGVISTLFMGGAPENLHLVVWWMYPICSQFLR